MQSRGSRGLQRSRPCPEPRIEADRRLTGIADRALDFLEIPRCKIVALPKVNASGGGLSRSISRDRIKLTGEPSGKLRKLTLAPPDLLQPLDQVGTLAIGLFQ